MGDSDNHTLNAIVGVLLPPLAALFAKGCGCDFIITFILWFTILGGVLYFFHTVNVPLCTNLLNLLLPPIGVMSAGGDTMEILIGLLFWIFFIVPGPIFAYYVSLKKMT